MHDSSLDVWRLLGLWQHRIFTLHLFTQAFMNITSTFSIQVLTQSRIRLRVPDLLLVMFWKLARPLETSRQGRTGPWRPNSWRLMMMIILSVIVLCLWAMWLLIVTGLLSRGQGPEGPATGHLDPGFSWISCVYEQMLRWYPRCQVATTCFSCSPPDLNLVVNPVYM